MGSRESERLEIEGHAGFVARYSRGEDKPDMSFEHQAWCLASKDIPKLLRVVEAQERRVEELEEERERLRYIVSWMRDSERMQAELQWRRDILTSEGEEE